jgi:hypothetical protein
LDLAQFDAVGNGTVWRRREAAGWNRGSVGATGVENCWEMSGHLYRMQTRRYRQTESVWHMTKEGRRNKKLESGSTIWLRMWRRSSP